MNIGLGHQFMLVHFFIFYTSVKLTLYQFPSMLMKQDDLMGKLDKHQVLNK